MRRPLLSDGVTRWPDPPSVERVAERRDEVVAEVREHAGRIAYELARLQGGEYGRERFETDAGEWTVKHEAGELAFLKFDATHGPEVYVVSRIRPRTRSRSSTTGATETGSGKSVLTPSRTPSRSATRASNARQKAS